MKKMMGASALALAAMLCVAVPAGAKDTAPASVQAGIPAEAQAVLSNLHPQGGDVRLPAAHAVLHLGDQYLFLPADEAKAVLTKVWGNPPDEVGNTLGLVYEKKTPLVDSAWAALITVQDTGHIKDDDAASQDYAAVLADMQKSQEEANPHRTQQGYPAMHLIGWAQAPSYDASTHSLIWARELAMEGAKEHGLNYDVRMLGRQGVLSLNMLTEMSSLGEVRGSAQGLAKAVTFEAGNGYADYNSSTDKTAEYGLAGLVAGGAVVAAASKFGLFGVIAAFGKWIVIGIAAVGASVMGFFRRMFGRNKDRDLL
jgi:uncharacterized membrane-anchored protein